MIQARNDALEARLGLFSRFAWRYDLDAAVLELSEGGELCHRCPIVAVGSYSERGGSWLAGWANEGLPVEVAARAHAVLGYAEQAGRPELEAPWVEGVLAEAWERAAVGAAVAGAVGLFRCPGDGVHLFLGLLDVRPGR